MPLALCRISAALALATLCAGPAQAQGKVEFGELAKSLLIPPGPTQKLPDWSLPMHPAIRWKDAGPRDAPKSNDPDALPLMREGSVFITINGQPSYTPSKPGSPPSLWYIVLKGTRQGRLEAELSQAAYADPTFDLTALLQPAGFRVRAMCKPEDISSGQTVFTVAVPGAHPAVVAHEWSGGSAGNMAWFKWAFTSQRAAKLKCE